MTRLIAMIMIAVTTLSSSFCVTAMGATYSDNREYVKAGSTRVALFGEDKSGNRGNPEDYYTLSNNDQTLTFKELKVTNVTDKATRFWYFPNVKYQKPNVNGGHTVVGSSGSLHFYTTYALPANSTITVPEFVVDISGSKDIDGNLMKILPQGGGFL